MLQVTKNVTYCGESYIETEEGTHLTVATMTAVMSDNNLLNISKNITLESLYNNFKDVIDADWQEFEDEIEQIMDNYTDVDTTNPFPDTVAPDPEEGTDDDDDGDDGDTNIHVGPAEDEAGEE